MGLAGDFIRFSRRFPLRKTSVEAGRRSISAPRFVFVSNSEGRLWYATSPMPNQIGRQKLPVDREKVRILVGEIGYTEAAKRTGIARNTLYQWNYRYKWSILPADSRSVRNVATCPHLSPVSPLSPI